MRVRVTEIESAKGYKDGERRITIKLEDPNAFYANELKVPEGALGLGKVDLDETYTVIFSRELAEPEPAPDQTQTRCPDIWHNRTSSFDRHSNCPTCKRAKIDELVSFDTAHKSGPWKP